MKTAYYTFTTWEENALAAGFDGAAASRQSSMVRQPEQQVRRREGDNVIDLNAWRAANRDADQCWAEPGDEEDWTEEEPELVLPEPRPRRDHRRAMLAAELVSTACVAAAALALIVRVLAF